MSFIPKRFLVSSLTQLTARRLASTTTFSGQANLLSCALQNVPQATYSITSFPNVSNVRFKSKGSKKRQKQLEEEAQDDDEESDDDKPNFDDIVVDKNTRILTTKLNSMRADAILKVGLGIARNKIEEMFYESRLRINGKRLEKKSDLCFEGDEVDSIVKLDPKTNFLTVARVEIMLVTPKKDTLQVKLKRCKNLLVENYPEDPWKESS